MKDDKGDDVLVNMFLGHFMMKRKEMCVRVL